MTVNWMHCTNAADAVAAIWANDGDGYDRLVHAMTRAEVADMKAMLKEQFRRGMEKAQAVHLHRWLYQHRLPRFYDVICVDPPWPMQKIKRNVRPNQTNFAYPTMTIAEIEAAVRAVLNLPVMDQSCENGFDASGNEFIVSDEPPYAMRWRSLRGSAVEKLAKFDQKLARQLARRKITLAAAKAVLLQRDVDAATGRQIAKLVASEAPYMGIVMRCDEGFSRATGVRCHPVLKCACGAARERVSWFRHERTYYVLCPECRTGLTFDEHGGGQFAFRPDAVPAPYCRLLETQCDIPIRELENDNGSSEVLAGARGQT